MTAERETPTLTDYWAILRRRRRTIALAMAIVIALAGVWVWWSGAQYASQASVVIRPILSGPFDQSRIDDVGAGTEAKVLDSTVVAELAAKKLHRTSADAPKLLEHLTVDNPIGTLILNIRYAASTPADAQRGAALSHWLIATGEPDDVPGLLAAGWEPIRDGVAPLTDDHPDLLRLLRAGLW